MISPLSRPSVLFILLKLDVIFSMVGLLGIFIIKMILFIKMSKDINYEYGNGNGNGKERQEIRWTKTELYPVLQSRKRMQTRNKVHLGSYP